MKRLLLFIALVMPLSSYAVEEFFYQCNDGTKAHQYVAEDGDVVMEFHGIKMSYQGINSANELSFRDNTESYLRSNRLSVTAITESKFRMYLLSEKNHVTTECDVIATKG